MPVAASEQMAVVSVRIPQIGEGLQEARLVAVLKQPGDKIRRDEPIYQMETDKAVMDVESPTEGVLIEWLAQPDDILPIGAEVARVEVVADVAAEPETPAEPTPEAATEEAAATTVGSRNALIPPKTKAYAKELGITDDELNHIPFAGSKMLPSDVDAYRNASATQPAYSDRPLSSKQRLLASRLVRGNQIVVPGTMSVACRWEALESRRAEYKASRMDFQPSLFTMFAYLVAQALEAHPNFRSTLVGDATLRTFDAASLGIAVALPEDELVLAVVESANKLDWPTFAARTRERIEQARTGVDQVNEKVTISLTNMQGFGLRDATPVVVPPMVATLFIGEVYVALDPLADGLKAARFANLALTFDHRVLNGVGAAEFLNAIKAAAEDVDSWIPAP